MSAVSDEPWVSKEGLLNVAPCQKIQLDRCDACSLVFLDPIELDFLTGRNIEQAFFRDPRLVTHCAHCKEPLQSPSHCGTLQRLSCSACKSVLYQSKVALRVTAPQQGGDPYRGSAQAGAQQYEYLSYRLEVCLSCHGILLQDALLEQLLALFAPRGKR